MDIHENQVQQDGFHTPKGRHPVAFNQGPPEYDWESGDDSPPASPVVPLAHDMLHTPENVAPMGNQAAEASPVNQAANFFPIQGGVQFGAPNAHVLFFQPAQGINDAFDQEVLPVAHGNGY